MPVTPFHFGPGGLIHALAPRHVSFLSFCAANVLMDVEPLYFMLTSQYPLHRFFHTYVGATIAAIGTVALFTLVLKLASLLRAPDPFHLKRLTLGAIASGAAIGAYSHILFDSVMHSDIEPFAPFSNWNGLYRIVSLAILHGFCLLAGTIATSLIVIRKGMAANQAEKPPWAE